MEKWYRLVLDHLKDHPPNFGDDNAQSVLEMLYGYYNQGVFCKGRFYPFTKYT